MFWRLTLDELADLYDVWADQQEREDYRAGVVAWAVMRSLGGAKDIEPMDFFKPKGNGHASESEIISAEESLEQWRELRDELKGGTTVIGNGN